MLRSFRMNTVFSQNLKKVLTQFKISNSQLAKALNVDPSLVSRWIKNGCGERRAEEHAYSIERYILRQNISSENRAWLSAVTGSPSFDTESGAIAGRLCSGAKYQQNGTGTGFPSLTVLDGFRNSIEEHPSINDRTNMPTLDVFGDIELIAELLDSELSKLPEGAAVDIYLTGESSSTAVNSGLISVLRDAVTNRKLTVSMLVESANNSAMVSRLIGTYMPMLVQGQFSISMIQGVPQTFIITMSVIIPEHMAIVITEASQRHSVAAAAVIRDSSVIQDMLDSYRNSSVLARPIMVAYDDTFARNIIEIFFEEYGVPGSLDVIKSGLNPLYLTVEQYGKVLREYGHTEDQYQWRYNEFSRFKSAMDEVLRSSRFREVLSLSKLREIAETGRCRMPSMYFFDAGIWYLDAQDCVNLFDGYINFLETVPNFQVVLLDDESIFLPNSCWHIKNNKHIMIHSWNVDEPKMVYSDQLILIDEFQRHFDSLWCRNDSGSRRQIIEQLTELRSRCAEHITG